MINHTYHTCRHVATDTLTLMEVIQGYHKESVTILLTVTFKASQNLVIVIVSVCLPARMHASHYKSVYSC